MSHPKEILLSLRANARKSLSQNFLTSPHWAQRLVASTLETPHDEVWEIGPGLGALTRELLKQTTKPVRIFEYDRKFCEYLRTELPAAEVNEGSALDAPFVELSKGKRIAILSNLPYHLSSPLFFKLLEIRAETTRLVLTFQKEFAERLIATPRSHAYGGVSVMAQLHYTIYSLGTLPPGAFYPKPGVASEALVFEPSARSESERPALSRVVRAAFAHRRKKVVRNLLSAFPD